MKRWEIAVKLLVLAGAAYAIVRMASESETCRDRGRHYVRGLFWYECVQ
jgi:hypothetical protein